MEAFLLLHPMAEKEAVEMEALYLEEETYVWWFKPLVHSRVSYFAIFSQRLIQTFDVERTKEEKSIPPWEDKSTNIVTALGGQNFTSMEEDRKSVV